MCNEGKGRVEGQQCANVKEEHLTCLNTMIFFFFKFRIFNFLQFYMMIMMVIID